MAQHHSIFTKEQKVGTRKKNSGQKFGYTFHLNDWIFLVILEGLENAIGRSHPEGARYEIF